MNYLEEIEPLIQRVYLARAGKGRMSVEHTRELVNIHYRYIRKPENLDPVNISCTNCFAVTHMFNQIIGLYERETERARSVKGDKMTFPKQEPITVEKEYKEPLTLEDLAENIKEIYTIESDTTVQVTEVIPKKWGAFKKYCTSKGLKVQGKTKKELLKELNEQ